MGLRRSRGEGSVSWNEQRARWIGRVSVGFYADGKRRVVSISAKTKTECLRRLREAVRDQDDGLKAGPRNYSVSDAVNDWLDHGLIGRDPNTVANRRSLACKHLISSLGHRRLVELSTADVDRWLEGKRTSLSSDTLARLLSILRASIRRAEARDLVKRNVAMLCDPPRGLKGRPSKSLTIAEAVALLDAAETHGGAMRAYITLSLLTGARTEELRALTWSHVDLDTDPATISLWRSVRRDGDTKTKSSRRTLELPSRCREALRLHRAEQFSSGRGAATSTTTGHTLVFAARSGTPLDAANVRREFRRVARKAGLDSATWTPRELRHSFVSILSASGVAVEEISHLVGHANSRVTEAVYRKELRPVLSRGATAMDALFPGSRDSGRPPKSPWG